VVLRPRCHPPPDHRSSPASKQAPRSNPAQGHDRLFLAPAPPPVFESRVPRCGKNNGQTRNPPPPDLTRCGVGPDRARLHAAACRARGGEQ
jgi:hypothetical protein